MNRCIKCQLAPRKCKCQPVWDLAWGKKPTFRIYEIRICPECGNRFAVAAKDRNKKNTCGMSCRSKQRYKSGGELLLRSPEAIKKNADNRRGKGKGIGYIKVNSRHHHRTVAEEKIGRLLAPGEVVHHINGNHRDNRPENLQVLPSQSEHATIHTSQRVYTRKTHCAHGHPISGDNVIVMGGRNRCLTCHKTWYENYKKSDKYKSKLKSQNHNEAARLKNP